MEANAMALPGKYLTFILKNQVYGVSIDAVREINRLSEITKVPQTPSFVAGVMNLRGKIIPVVNLRLKFSIEEAQHTKQTCIIVIEAGTSQVGMIVDSVSDVIELGPNQIEPNPSIGVYSDKSFVMGMGKVEEKVIMLIDIVGCLSKENFDMCIQNVEKTS